MSSPRHWGLAGRGGQQQPRRQRLGNSPSFPARPRPLLLPFNGDGAGGQARGAGTKGSGTNTHLEPEQKTAALAASPVLNRSPGFPCRRGPSPHPADSREPGAPSHNPTFSLLWRWLLSSRCTLHRERADVRGPVSPLFSLGIVF